MRDNLELTGGLLLAENVTNRLTPTLGRLAAHELVSELVRQAVDEHRSFHQVLTSDERVYQVLSASDVDDALDPNNYLGVAPELVDRALAAYRNGRTAS
ncbi:MAG TPA: hypothetical protein VHZ97_05770 [Pseudonocardiaceae bacterium]|nr:hypothetical protein [Pseudonocardiaceae bacterium]